MASTKTSGQTRTTTAQARATVAVLSGGLSSEREVSLKSGQAVSRALGRLGYQVERLDLTSKDLKPLTDLTFDVAFLALHGTFGEDGELQTQLDTLGIHYSGSGAQASRDAMDKLRAKTLFLKNGVPTAPYHDVTSESTQADINRMIRRLGLPVVVKPAAEGSSVGVSKVDTLAELMPAIENALTYGPRAMIERYVPGREIVVAILDEKPLPPVEIHTAEPFFTYSAKYENPKTTYDVDPDLTPELRKEIQRVGLAAHVALGCRHFSRADIIFGPDGQLTVLEVNTLPGLTERSLLPKAAAADGLSFPKLCEKIVDLALENGTAQ